MSGSLNRGDGENVPGIPDACAPRNFMDPARGPLVPNVFYGVEVGRNTRLIHLMDAFVLRKIVALVALLGKRLVPDGHHVCKKVHDIIGSESPFQFYHIDGVHAGGGSIHVWKAMSCGPKSSPLPF